MAKILPIEGRPGEFIFDCPGCGHSHVIWTTIPNSYGAPFSWTYNGNPDSPTFTPSLLNYVDDQKGNHIIRCHLYIRNGVIEYLGDCKHKLAGQKVAMEEM